jgi:hypothetical protein
MRIASFHTRKYNSSTITYENTSGLYLLLIGNQKVGQGFDKSKSEFFLDDSTFLSSLGLFRIRLSSLPGREISGSTLFSAESSSSAEHPPPVRLHRPAFATIHASSRPLFRRSSLSPTDCFRTGSVNSAKHCWPAGDERLVLWHRTQRRDDQVRQFNFHVLRNVLTVCQTVPDPTQNIRRVNFTSETQRSRNR